MKKMKKVLAFLLAMVMVLGMSVTSLAADNKIGNADDVGNIKVQGITVEDGVTVKAYQIIKAKYDNDVFAGYELVYPDVEGADITLTDKDGKPVNVEITEAQLSKLAAYLTDEETTLPDDAVVRDMTLGADGTATANDLPVGSYLVMIEGAETKVYNPTVVSIYYVNADGTGNTLDEGELNIVSTENAWVKVSDAPHVEKWMLEDDETIKGNTVNIGDEVEFMVPVTPIPNYGGEYPVFNVVDTLDKGLALNQVDGAAALAVYVSGGSGLDSGFGTDMLSKDTDYTLTTDTVEGRTVITVDFVVNGAYTLNDYVGKDLVIMYTATLTADAETNHTGNENNVVLNYTHDSKTNGNDGTSTDRTYTYTFDIDGGVSGTSTTLTKLTEGLLTKTGEKTETTITVGEEEIENVLSGAEFTLYTVNPDEFTGTADELAAKVYTNASGFTGVVKSDTNGQLPIRGLEAGTYYLKETKAPTGYSLNTHVFEIKIEASINEENGQLDAWTITIDNTTTNTFAVSHTGDTKTVTINGGDKLNTVQVPNTTLSSLPSTGGIGTTIFTIGGCAIMIIAAGLYFASRRKRTEK